jgi:hypothetical protein
MRLGEVILTITLSLASRPAFGAGFTPTLEQKKELTTITAAFGRLDELTDIHLDCPARDALADTYLRRIEVPPKTCPAIEKELAELQRFDAALGADCLRVRESLTQLHDSPTRCAGASADQVSSEVSAAREILASARDTIRERYTDGNGFGYDHLTETGPCAFQAAIIAQYARRMSSISTKLYGKGDYLLDEMCGENEPPESDWKELLAPPAPLPDEILGRDPAN